MAHVQTQVSVVSSHQAYGPMPAVAPLQSDVQMVLVITSAQRCKVVASKMVKLPALMAAALRTMTCA